MKKIIITLLCILLLPTLAFSKVDKAVALCNKSQMKLACMTKLAKKNNTKAQFNLGVLYAFGHGVKKDTKQAIYWYTKSANGGNIYAQSTLGRLYFQGKDIKQDYKKALYWYTESAKAGNVRDQDIVAGMYINGQGTTKSYINAYAWAYVSMHNSNLKTNVLHSQLEPHMSKSEIKQAKSLALELIKVLKIAHNRKNKHKK